jgi:phosphoribosylformimino-5-aminoimidazole carboxamide ribotide isomerase
VQIIPVIDLMGGIVVHAKAGHRHQYLPLKSTMTNSSEPLQVIEALLSYHSFSAVYIADLDAITAGVDNRVLYQQILGKFPDITIWLDAGIKTKEQKDLLEAISGLIPIVASESWSDPESFSWNKSDILSLDFKQGSFLGPDVLLKRHETWPDTVIAMNLDCIGSEVGPDIALIKALKSKRSDIKLVMAGGVGSERDLDVLESEGVAAVLVASALHKGTLSKRVLKKYN